MLDSGQWWNVFDGCGGCSVAMVGGWLGAMTMVKGVDERQGDK